MNPSTQYLSVTTFLPSVQALTALWCHTHRGLLLEDEIERDRGIGRSEAAWEQVRAAALEGRVADIPIAGETLAAWRFEDVLVDGVLEGCVDLLPSALVAVETVWGESRPDNVPREALRAAFEVAAARRERILEDYRPPASDVPSPWHEIRQGCARPDAMARRRVLHLVDRAISRSPDRWMTARVELARATEYDAERRYKDARGSLDAAVRASWPFKNIDRREPAGVALAEHLWRCAEVVRARQLLAQLRGELARELSRRIEDKAPDREALADAERAHEERSGVDSWSTLIFAHLSAGHGIAAERMAQELCTAHPDAARSWETRARVLHANARFRSAVDPAVKWTDLAPDSAPARALLARAFARVGYIGREPAGSIAAAAIELCESGQVLPIDELAELAEICYRAQSVDWARRADDLVWARCAGTRAGRRMARRGGPSPVPRSVVRGRAGVDCTPCRTWLPCPRKVGGGAGGLGSALVRAHRPPDACSGGVAASGDAIDARRPRDCSRGERPRDARARRRLSRSARPRCLRARRREHYRSAVREFRARGDRTPRTAVWLHRPVEPAPFGH